VAYGYDDLGRFSSVSTSVDSVSSVVSYSYLPDSDLLAGYTLTPVGSTSSLTVSRTYEDHRNLILSVSNAWDGTPVSSFEYENDPLGRRIRRLDALPSYPFALTNSFGYNPRSELTEALMGTNGYGYAYDPIGNRKWARNNAESNSYLANELNQYLSVTSAAAAVQLSYDADGNLASYNGWTFTWDVDNRLILVSNAETIVRNTYDFMSRRVEKTVSGISRRFLYDGWNLIAELGTWNLLPGPAEWGHVSRFKN
jgi:YD repeat-containing protein